jgi:cyclophilin family peptidyl-prolyl cis-trans isomerase
VAKLPKTRNTTIKHDVAGILGVTASAPNQFYLTLQKNAGLDNSGTALGKVVAGLSQLQEIKKGDPIRSIRFTRVGQAARDFKTDDEAFNKLVPPAKKK